MALDPCLPCWDEPFFTVGRTSRSRRLSCPLLLRRRSYLHPRPCLPWSGAARDATRDAVCAYRTYYSSLACCSILRPFGLKYSTSGDVAVVVAVVVVGCDRVTGSGGVKAVGAWTGVVVGVAGWWRTCG